MPETTLAAKLKLKAGQRAIMLNAPDGYLAMLQPLPEDLEVTHELAGSADWIQVFVKTRAGARAAPASGARCLEANQPALADLPQRHVQDSD